MSVATLDASEFGLALACGILAVRSRTDSREGLMEAVRGLARTLESTGQANRKTYALRYGALPSRAPTADQITAAAKGLVSSVIANPQMCAPYQGGTPVNGILANVDPKHMDDDDTKTLQGLHMAIEAWNPLNARAAARREREARAADVATGRYPWLGVHRGPDDVPYIQSKPDASNIFTKALATALKVRTGRTWSVKRSRGSSYVRVDAPPARRQCDWEGKQTGKPDQYACRDDRQVLGNILNEGRLAHSQGEMISPDPGCWEHAYDTVTQHPNPAVCRHDFDR